MSNKEKGAVTDLLPRVRHGDAAAAEQVLELLYAELKSLARARMKGERPGHTLQPTALVNEAYLRLFEHHPPDVHDRQHFLALASRQMRRILIDHARGVNAHKRGDGAAKVTLEGLNLRGAGGEVDAFALDEALEALHRADPRAAEVAELKLFGGCTDAEAGLIMNSGIATLRRDWRFARTFLTRRLHD